MSHLRGSAPDVINLSLEDNNISDFRQLDHLKALPLRELILRDNPIAVDPQTYQAAIKTRFPLLEFLDMNKINPIVKFNIPRGGEMRLPEGRGGWVESEALFACQRESVFVFVAHAHTTHILTRQRFR